MKGEIMDYPENFAPISRSNYIDDRVVQLMNTEPYNPASPENIMDAVELALNSQDELERLQDYFDQRDFEKLGRMIWVWAMDYAENTAQRRAEKEYDEGRINPWLA